MPAASPGHQLPIRARAAGLANKSCHPTALKRYKRAVADLAGTLTADKALVVEAAPAFDAIRTLVSAVIVPAAPNTEALQGRSERSSCGIVWNRSVPAVFQGNDTVGSGGGTRTPDPRIMISPFS